MKLLRSCMLGAIAASAIVGGAQPASAGPLPVGASTVKAAAPTEVVDVRYRRGGGAVIAGAAAGLIGGLIASQAYAPRYYGYYPPAYYPPAYYPPVYGPIYYGPTYYPAYPYYGSYVGGPYVVYRAVPVYRPARIYRPYVKRVRKVRR
jgi:hypothetical protein